MKLKDMLFMSFGNLYKRKLRTSLTVAGVIIGTCAIVVMVSLGIGSSQSMNEMMAQIGDLTVIQVMSQSGGGSGGRGGGMVVMSSVGGSNDGGSGGVKEKNPLDDKMIEYLKGMEHVAAVTPIFQLDWNVMMLKSGKYEYQGQFIGMDLSTLEAFGYKVENGALPGAGAAENTIMIGADALYQFRDPKKRGSKAYRNNQPDSKGKIPDPFVDPLKDKLTAVTYVQSSNGMQELSKKKPTRLSCTGTLAQDWSKNPSPSYAVFMDLALAKKLQEQHLKESKQKPSTNKGYSNVSLKVDDVSNVAAVEATIKELGYNTYSMTSIREPMEKQMQSQQIFLGGIGAVSLLVAAIGIANTMIMSIYERTREIGVMKVLGCVIGNIRAMFLTEAAIIGLMGGVIGLGLSYGISAIINSVGVSFLGMMGGGQQGAQASIIPVWLAAGAVVFAIGIGLVSGLAPANRAVKIQALTAIKQE